MKNKKLTDETAKLDEIAGLKNEAHKPLIKMINEIFSKRKLHNDSAYYKKKKKI
jgi:hypothetical protein